MIIRVLFFFNFFYLIDNALLIITWSSMNFNIYSYFKVNTRRKYIYFFFYLVGFRYIVHLASGYVVWLFYHGLINSVIEGVKFSRSIFFLFCFEQGLNLGLLLRHRHQGDAEAVALTRAATWLTSKNIIEIMKILNEFLFHVWNVDFSINCHLLLKFVIFISI